jgi:hypothetical protein
MTEEMMVEGYRVVIKKSGEFYLASVPGLKGCATVKVADKEQVEPQIMLAIMQYHCKLFGLPVMRSRLKLQSIEPPGNGDSKKNVLSIRKK